MREGASVFTDKSKHRLALAIALRTAWSGAVEEAEETVSLGRLAALVSGALTAYGALLAAPEVMLSKTTAAVLAGVLWLYLGAEVLDVANRYVQMTDEVDVATSFDAVRGASERFGHRMGQKTMRLLVMVGTAVLAPKAGDVGATLRELPAFEEAAVAAGGPGGGAALSNAVTEAEAVALAKDRLTLLVPVGVATITSVAKVAGSGGGSAAPGRKTPPVKAGAPAPKSAKPTGYKEYSSHKSFKRAMGSAGPGKEWHHVVEQTPGNVQKFGARMLHNTVNEVAIDAQLHRDISALYSSKDVGITNSTTRTIRQWLSEQPFEAQREFGLMAIQKVRAGIW